MIAGYVYSIRNLKNGYGYIGQTHLSGDARWKRHIRDASKPGGRALLRAIREYGAENFTFEQMMSFDSKEDLDRAETEMIRACNTLVKNGRGYNKHSRGSGRTAEERLRISRTLTGRLLTPEHKAKCGAALRGKTRPTEVVEAVRAALSTAEVRAVISRKIKTIWDNRKANGVRVAHIKKENCKRGHAFDAKNTYVSKQGHRYCRACKVIHERARLKRLSSEAKVPR